MSRKLALYITEANYKSLLAYMVWMKGEAVADRLKLEADGAEEGDEEYEDAKHDEKVKSEIVFNLAVAKFED